MKYLLNGVESDRLEFRLFTQRDLKDIEILYVNPIDRIFLALPTEPSAKELCDIWFNYCIKRYDNDRGGMNALIDNASGKLVGMSGLLVQEVDGIEELEVAYAILPQYRNQGYAGEAVRKCRDVAFERAYAESLISIIHLDNIGSQKVALKNGMSKTRISNLKGVPYYIYRIDRSEWKS